MFLKPLNPIVDENMSNIVVEGHKPRTKDVDSENLNQTLDSLNACDKPPREDNI